jgi:hypothetical protein
MKDKMFYCLTFDSTHYAIKTEKKLKENNLDVSIIPTPREISASCGLSIKFLDFQKDDICKLLDSEDFERINLYKIDKSGEKNKSERMEWSK